MLIRDVPDDDPDDRVPDDEPNPELVLDPSPELEPNPELPNALELAPPIVLPSDVEVPNVVLPDCAQASCEASEAATRKATPASDRRSMVGALGTRLPHSYCIVSKRADIANSVSRAA